MATCPECDAQLEIDDDDLEEMEVGDQEVAAVGFLVANPVAQGSHPVAQVEFAGGAVAGNEDGRG